MVATVPAPPSTLEDYAGRNLGNGIEPPFMGAYGHRPGFRLI